MAQTKIAGLFLDPTVISGLTAITDGASNADYLFVWDAGTSTLKKILPDNLGLAAAAHTIESHTATSATGANLETLTNAGDADALHTHALKASLAAPALTGHATATTQAGTDDSTRIATTAHVKDVKIDDLTAGDNNTDLDSSTSRHGLLLKLGGGTTNFLRADGAWAAAGGGIASVAADTSPQLGGSLDAQNNTILNVGNANSDWTAGTLSIATSGGVFLNMDTYSTTANEASNINLRRSKNATLGSFSQVVANDSMGTINFQGSTSSGFTGGPTISGISTESRTSSAGGSKLEIKTIANSSTTPVLAMTIDQNAEVTVKENASMPSVTQGIAKAWIKWSTSGSSSGSIVGHHGWSSISYGGATGDSDHTMGVTFTSIDKQVFTAVTDDARIVCIGTSSTTTVTTRVYVVSSSGLAGSDVGRNMMAVFGELA